MSQLTRDELAALIKQADEICRQAQELQQQLNAAMRDRARGAQPAKSTSGRKTTRKRR